MYIHCKCDLILNKKESFIIKYVLSFERRQVKKGNVIFWAIFWGASGLGVHVGYFNMLHLPKHCSRPPASSQQYSLIAAASLSRIMCPVALQNLFMSSLTQIKSSRSCPGLQTRPYLSLSICKGYGKYKSDSWRPLETCC